MKSTESMKELRSLTVAALNDRIATLRTTIDKARIEAGFGQVKNHQSLGTHRRQLAQALTEQAERLNRAALSEESQ